MLVSYLDIMAHYGQYGEAQQNLCTDVEVWFKSKRAENTRS